MQEKSIRVMNMVRRTLLESPEVTDRALYAAAVALEPAMGELSLQQFQARYPRHVRRVELGGGRGRKHDRTLPPDALPTGERPHLYAPGEDTLIPETDAAQESVRADPALLEDEASLSPALRGARRRVREVAANPTAEADGEVGARDTSSTPAPEDPTAVGAHSVEAQSNSPQPWPLRLHPDAAGREPAKRSRPQSARSGRASGLRLVRSQSPSEPAPSNPAERSSGVREESAAATADRANESAGRASERDHLTRSRTEIRRLLFAWAHELVTAETRAGLVGVLARADEYVDSICDAGTRNEKRPHGKSEIGLDSRATNRRARERQPAPRPARPAVTPRKRIQDYKPGELEALVQWVASDDRHGMDDEIVNAVFAELGFRRRGRRITATIRSVLDRVRAGI